MTGWLLSAIQTINQKNSLTHQIVGEPTLVGTVDTHKHIHCIQHICVYIYIDIVDEAVTEV